MNREFSLRAWDKFKSYIVRKSQPGSSSVHVPSTGEEDKVIVKTKGGHTIEIGGKSREHDPMNLEELKNAFLKFIDEEAVEKNDIDEHLDQLEPPLDNLEAEILKAAVEKEWITINGAHIDPEHGKGAVYAVPKGGKGHGGKGHGGHSAHGHGGGHGEHFNPLEAATEAATESADKAKVKKASTNAVLGPEALDTQSVIEGMDWELSHGVTDPDVAREVVLEVLGKDPDHYKLLMDYQNSSDDVLENSEVNKDTLENEEDPYSGEGFNVDIGSGHAREPGYIGLDLYPYDHGTMVHDVHQGLPFEDESVQNVRMVNSLHTMDELSQDPKPLLSEIHRVLMPGGQFIYEGPDDIYSGPEWSEDFPGLVLTDHEDNDSNVKKDRQGDPASVVRRMTFTRVATPDPATANDAEPRVGVSSFDELPSDALLAVSAMDYYFSDSTSSGKGNRLHGYPSQGALLNKSQEEEVEPQHEKDVRQAFHPNPVNPPRPTVRKSKRLTILKSSTSPMKQIVYCVVLAPGEVDTQDEWMKAEEIEKAAHQYLVKSRVVGVQHSKVADSEVVESYIAPQDMDFDGQYGPQVVTKGSWVIGIKVNDPELWQKVLDGEITGVSVGGVGVKEGSPDDKE